MLSTTRTIPPQQKPRGNSSTADRCQNNSSRKIRSSQKHPDLVKTRRIFLLRTPIIHIYRKNLSIGFGDTRLAVSRSHGVGHASVGANTNSHHPRDTGMVPDGQSAIRMSHTGIHMWKSSSEFAAQEMVLNRCPTANTCRRSK